MIITKREIIISIAIAALMIIFGLFIANTIQDKQNDKNAEYYRAIHIETTDLFQYAMDTNVGNAFVYGDLKAIDTVTFDEIGGQYMYIKKVEEHYNMHTRTVTKTRTVNGKTETYAETEIYYSWDYYNDWDKHCNQISFCDITFDYGVISYKHTHYIDTIYKSSHIRYIYYGINTQYTGTVYANLANHTITNAKFFNNYDIDTTLEHCTNQHGVLWFWIGWSILIGAMIFTFYYIDNRWLEY